MTITKRKFVVTITDERSHVIDQIELWTADADKTIEQLVDKITDCGFTDEADLDQYLKEYAE
jgi:hypothetical protein